MEDKDNDSQNTKIKLFPIILCIGACVFIYILSYYRGKSAAISSLAGFTLSVCAYFVLITAFNEFLKKILKKRKSDIPEINITEPEAEETDPRQNNEGLIEIKKEIPRTRQESAGPEKLVCSCVYIISFLGITFWRLRGMFKVRLLSLVDAYSPGIEYAVLLLILPCVAVLYLKTRKDDSLPMDKISGGMLSLFSYVSFIYAAVIAAAAVLKINTMSSIILPWVYYLATIYLVVSLGINITLTLLKGDILSFDYTLIPAIFRAKDKSAGFEDAAAQWKISLKSLYTIRYTLQILPALALALVFVLFISTTVFVVQPHQQAAVYHFGKLDRDSIKDTGLHFKFPWPIDKAEIYDVHRAASMQIGYESSGTANFLWTQKHDIGEYMLLLGNGNEMVAVNLKIIYVISDLYSYIKTYSNAEAVLGAAAYNALMKRTIITTLDTILSVDRNSLSTSVLDELSDFCKSEELGFSVIQVIIESIHPPVDIADVYQRVVSASVDKTTTIIKARSHAQTKVLEAERLTAIALGLARSMRHNRTSDAQKEAAVFYAATEAHGISPASYELAKNLEVYEKIIKGRKVYVFSRGTENAIPKFVIGKFNTFNVPYVNRGVFDE